MSLCSNSPLCDPRLSLVKWTWIGHSPFYIFMDGTIYYKARPFKTYCHAHPIFISIVVGAICMIGASQHLSFDDCVGIQGMLCDLVDGDGCTIGDSPTPNLCREANTVVSGANDFLHANPTVISDTVDQFVIAWMPWPTHPFIPTSPDTSLSAEIRWISN